MKGTYYYIPVWFYDTPEMKLIDYQPNGDSAGVLVHVLAGIHTRSVTARDDGTFAIATDDGTFTDAEVMEKLASIGYRTNPAKYARDLAVIAKFSPFGYLAYSEAECEEKTPEDYR